jgi:hypothetical protein
MQGIQIKALFSAGILKKHNHSLRDVAYVGFQCEDGDCEVL